MGSSFLPLRLFFSFVFLCSFSSTVAFGDPYKQLESAKTGSDIYSAVEGLTENREIELKEQVLNFLLTVPEGFFKKPTKLRIPNFPVVELLVSRGTESVELIEKSTYITKQRYDKELEAIAYIIDKVAGKSEAENYVTKQIAASSGHEQKNWNLVLKYQKSLDRKNFMFTSKNNSSSSTRGR